MAGQAAEDPADRAVVDLVAEAAELAAEVEADSVVMAVVLAEASAGSADRTRMRGTARLATTVRTARLMRFLFR